MEDLTLKSDLFNNIKFNMQKLILDVPEADAEWLGNIFKAPKEEVEELITGLQQEVKEQAERLADEMNIPSVSKECTVAFVGDSITSDRSSYFNIFRYLYREKKRIHLVDAAVSGDKSDDAVMKFYERTLSVQPDVVHILLGTNDLRHNHDLHGHSCISLEEYGRNLEYMIKTLRDKDVPVIVSEISPVINERLKKRFPNDNWSYDIQEIEQLNRSIRKIAEKYGAELNSMGEIYRKYTPEELLLEDGLHLNGKGQLLLAKEVLKKLAKYI